MEGVLADKLRAYAERGATKIKLGLTDIDGVLRGKYISLAKFASVMEKGGGFCDCVFGWDMDDVLYEGPAAERAYTGWHTGFPDAKYQLLVASERWLSDENCPFFLGQFVADDGSAHALCPRTRLVANLSRLNAAGFTLKSGFEYEFFVFEESPRSVREKDYRQLVPLSPGNFGYSVLRTTQHADLFTGLMDHAAALDCSLEGLHCETGPGVWEAALAALDGASSADAAALFKLFTKGYLHRAGLIGTFMAKWSMDYPGQSGHFHFSLLDKESGDNAFFDASQAAGASALQRAAIAGLQHFLPELLPCVAPTINSYARLVRGAWAPTAATWGEENRTCAIRLIGGSSSSQRIECRVPGADANPYLVAAAVIAAALEGINQNLHPDEPIRGNAYDVQETLPPERQFSGQLRSATDRFQQSTVARDYFGDAFVDHFAMSRYWECERYEQHVTDWQLARYFEIV